MNNKSQQKRYEKMNWISIGKPYTKENGMAFVGMRTVVHKLRGIC